MRLYLFLMFIMWGKCSAFGVYVLGKVFQLTDVRMWWLISNNSYYKRPLRKILSKTVRNKDQLDGFIPANQHDYLKTNKKKTQMYVIIFWRSFDLYMFRIKRFLCPRIDSDESLRFPGVLFQLLWRGWSRVRQSFLCSCINYTSQK